MKEEIKNQWVAALRSGKYKQGKGALRDTENRFCCLGVLCDISGFKEWEYGGQIFQYLGCLGTLPREVREWSGVCEPDGLYGRSKGRQDAKALTLDNDDGKTFDQIADIIEANWRQI